MPIRPLRPRRAHHALAALLVLACAAAVAHAAPRTVCTITVNSPDEKEAMRRHLPKGDYRFVELVEHGRPDWLDSACRANVQCDVLVVSGHFNGHDFFSDKTEAQEYLPVAEMERASCSNACPSLFSHLKEVYLFGCTSLSPEAALNPAGEIERTLVRGGMAPAEAQRIARSTTARHGESNRDVMRRVFMNVPAIYGFSAVAPLGPVSGNIIDRYFRASGTRGFGTGNGNRGLVGAFAAHGMTVVPGLRAGDPQAAYRADVCRFADDRASAAGKLAFVHTLLDRGMAETRLFLDHVEAFVASVTDADRADPRFAAALADIAADAPARARYLDYVHDNGEPDVRARMLDVAHALGWLDASQLRTERARLVGDLLAQADISAADIALACRLGAHDALSGELPRLAARAGPGANAARGAVLACLGDAAERTRMLAGLARGDQDSVRAAEVYLAARPLQSIGEVHALVDAIAGIEAAEPQVRALHTLARQPLLDGAALEPLVALFARTPSIEVQRAIAGVLIRSDRPQLAAPQLLHTLRATRLRSRDREDMVDLLIRRLDGFAAAAQAERDTPQRGDAPPPA
jgi:hypothetical protein